MKTTSMVVALTLMFGAAASAASPDADAGAARALGAWFNGLRGLEKGTSDGVVRVAWYGDSAIVGDGYTAVVRERLQDRFGDAGPGFMLPSPTFDGYLRDGVRMKRSGWDAFAVISGDVKAGNYGYGGVVATSHGGAATTFEAGKAEIAVVEVYYQAVPKGGVIQLFIDGAAKSSYTKDTEAASTQDLVWRQVLDQPAKSVKVRAGGEGVVKVYGVSLGQGSGVQLDAIGILGMRARRWTNADAGHLKGQVAARAPGLIVLNFGGNERVDESLSVKSHTDDMTKALAALKAGAPKAACLIVGPLAHGEAGGTKLDPNLETIYEAQKKVAAAQGCAFFDTLAVMGGAKGLKTWASKGWISGDMAHLTPKGHDKLGALMSEWLMGHYDRWARGN